MTATMSAECQRCPLKSGGVEAMLALLTGVVTMTVLLCSCIMLSLSMSLVTVSAMPQTSYPASILPLLDTGSTLCANNDFGGGLAAFTSDSAYNQYLGCQPGAMTLSTVTAIPSQYQGALTLNPRVPTVLLSSSTCAAGKSLFASDSYLYVVCGSNTPSSASNGGLVTIPLRTPLSSTRLFADSQCTQANVIVGFRETRSGGCPSGTVCFKSYVACYMSATASLVETTGAPYVSSFNAITSALCPYPTGMALTPDFSALWVTCYGYCSNAAAGTTSCLQQLRTLDGAVGPSYTDSGCSMALLSPVGISQYLSPYADPSPIAVYFCSSSGNPMLSAFYTKTLAVGPKVAFPITPKFITFTPMGAIIMGGGYGGYTGLYTMSAVLPNGISYTPNYDRILDNFGCGDPRFAYFVPSNGAQPAGALQIGCTMNTVKPVAGGSLFSLGTFSQIALPIIGDITGYSTMGLSYSGQTGLMYYFDLKGYIATYSRGGVTNVIQNVAGVPTSLKCDPLSIFVSSFKDVYLGCYSQPSGAGSTIVFQEGSAITSATTLPPGKPCYTFAQSPTTKYVYMACSGSSSNFYEVQKTGIGTSYPTAVVSVAGLSCPTATAVEVMSNGIILLACASAAVLYGNTGGAYSFSGSSSQTALYAWDRTKGTLTSLMNGATCAYPSSVRSSSNGLIFVACALTNSRGFPIINPYTGTASQPTNTILIFTVTSGLYGIQWNSGGTPNIQLLNTPSVPCFSPEHLSTLAASYYMLLSCGVDGLITFDPTILFDDTGTLSSALYHPGRITKSSAVMTAFEQSQGSYSESGSIYAILSNSNQVVSASMLQIFGCPSGYEWREDATDCVQCSPGFYRSDYMANAQGLSAPMCAPCNSLAAAEFPGTKGCYACQNGKYRASAFECGLCGPGTYSDDSKAFTTCYNCVGGTFAAGSIAGGPLSTGCKNCDPGYFSLDQASQCTPCWAGYFSPGAVSSCSPCPAGTYSGASASVCLFCPPGTMSIAGAMSCTNCTAGYYATGGAANCTACDAGKYSPGGASSCIRCDPGYYEPSSGSPACIPSPAGTAAPGWGNIIYGVCDAGTYSGGGVASCSPCASGSISFAGSALCIPCAPGTIPNGLLSACMPCSAGTYKSSAVTCSACGIGKYSSGGSDSISQCISCDAGFYSNSPLTGAGSCTLCPVGKFAQGQNNWQCTACQSGFTAPNGSASCFPSPTGFFADLNDLSAPKPCGMGQSSYRAASGCFDCFPGSFNPDLGAPQCTPCAAGHFSSTSRAVTCSACDGGSYAAANSSACLLCAAGTFSGPQAASCTNCSAGYFSGGQAKSCQACPAGKFNPGGLANCPPCGAGTYSSGGAIACLNCTTGNIPDATASTCVPCKAGSIAAPGDSNCTNCDPGRFTKDDGSPRCLPCAAGTAAVSPGSSICIPCTAGYYAAGGAATCQPCSGGTFSGPGAGNCTQCSAGYLSSDAATSCSPCPVGTANLFPGQRICPACNAGSVASGGALQCSPCAPGYIASADGSKCQNCLAGSTSTASAVRCDQCQPGFYSRTSASPACIPCPPGSFSDGYGASVCTPCSPGSFSLGSASCKACQPGSFSSSSSAASCTPCSMGSFAPFQNMSACLPCPVGAFGNQTGLSACLLCEAGRFSSLPGVGACLPCPAGSSNMGLNATICDACPPGQFTNGIGGMNCTWCDPGRYSGTFGLSVCSSCATGMFSNVTGLSVCFSCDPGKYSDLTGASRCSDCHPGTENSLSGSPSCGSCPPGSVSNMSGTVVCTPCGKGTAQNSPGKTVCDPCRKGTYQPLDSDAGALLCSTCPAGSYSDQDGASVCSPCPKGLYQNGTGQTACAQCAPGSSSNDEGAVSCVPCASGTYSSRNTTGLCLPCPAGQFQSESGKTRCELCNPGEYQHSSTVPAPSCIPCPPGRYTNDSGTIECPECIAGKYKNFTQTECEFCDPGLTSSAGAIECFGCPSGRAYSFDAHDCVNCANGTYQSESKQLSCILCPPGKYQGSEKEPAPRCDECFPGFYSNNYGSSACLPCPLGRYSPETSGSVRCLDCPEGQVGDHEGLRQCTYCVSGEYQFKSGQSMCLKCTGLVGVTCDGGKLNVSKGYFLFTTSESVLGTTNQTVAHTVQCASSVACIGGVLDDQCGAHRVKSSSNLLCGDCEDGYSEENGKCVPCGSSQGGLVFLLLVGCWVYVVVIHNASQSTDNGIMGIAIYWIQTALFLAGTPAEWLQFLHVLSLSPMEAAGQANQGSAPDRACVLKLSAFQSLAVGIVVSIVFFALHAFNYLSHAIIARLLGAKIGQGVDHLQAGGSPQPVKARLVKLFLPFRPSAYVRTLIQLLFFCYSQVCTAVFRYLQCVDVGGTRVVYTAPSVHCSDSEYKSWLIVVILLLIGYVAGLPIVLTVFFVIRRRFIRASPALSEHTAAAAALSSETHADFDSVHKSLAVDADGLNPHEIKVFHKRWNAVFAPFRRSCYYWQFVFIARRTLIIAVMTFAYYDAAGSQTGVQFIHGALLAFHAYLRPFSSRLCNWMETISLACLIALSALLVPNPSPPYTTAQQILIAIIILFVTLLFIFLVIAQKFAARKAAQAASTVASRNETASGPGAEDHAYGERERAAHANNPKLKSGPMGGVFLRMLNAQESAVEMETFTAKPIFMSDAHTGGGTQSGTVSARSINTSSDSASNDVALISVHGLGAKGSPAPTLSAPPSSLQVPRGSTGRTVSGEKLSQIRNSDSENPHSERASSALPATAVTAATTVKQSQNQMAPKLKSVDWSVNPMSTDDSGPQGI